MTPEIDRFYDLIGDAALEIAGTDLGGRLLVYAEAGDGVSSCAIFYVSRSGKVTFRFGPTGLIYDLWEAWRARGEPVWSAMSCVIEDSKFKMEFQFADQVSDDESEIERRPRAVKAAFGDVLVDYSNPSGVGR